MKKIYIIFAILLIFWPSVSSAETINGLEVEWGSASTHTLSWTNPSISKEGYTISVIDFDWLGQATISVTYRGEIQHGILSLGENAIFNFTKNNNYFQGVKIEVEDISRYDRTSTPPVNTGTFPCCPQAEITVTISKEITRKKPELELEASLSWDGRSGYSSPMNITISNTGEAAFSEGNVTVNINGLKIADEQELANNALVYKPSESTVTRTWDIPLLPNSSYSFNVSLKPPFPPQSDKSTFTIKVDAYFKDFDGKVYYSSETKDVSLVQTINIDKKITGETVIGQKKTDEFYPDYVSFGIITIVNLYVTNLQSYPLRGVSLTDNIIEGFSSVDNKTELLWTFDLNASERKEFRYEMNAHKTGTFMAPAATAQWTEWGVRKIVYSNMPSTRVYGVYLLVRKTADKTRIKLNESTGITVSIEAPQGRSDFPAGINVTDTLPGNATLISGTTSYSGVVRPLQSVSFKYNISAGGPGELELPYPQVTFWKKEYEGSYDVIPPANITVFEPSAVLPEVTAISPNITTTPAPLVTPVPKSLISMLDERAPWLEGVVPIIMLFITVILMLMLHNLNREP